MALDRFIFLSWGVEVNGASGIEAFRFTVQPCHASHHRIRPKFKRVLRVRRLEAWCYCAVRHLNVYDKRIQQ